MKLITFSLWGNEPMYCEGAIENAKLIASIYPGWTGRFYVGRSTDQACTDALRQHGSQVVEMDEQGDWTALFWRFQGILDKDVEVMISRDTDCRLNLREKAAVDEWIASDKGFHIMRDHPWHRSGILGGMWGMKEGTPPNFEQLLSDANKQDQYDTDQAFLRERIYPLIKNNVVVHDEFFEKKPFPTKRKGLEFVGQVFYPPTTTTTTTNTGFNHAKALAAALEKP